MSDLFGRLQSALGDDASRAQAVLDDYRGRLSDEQRENRRVGLMQLDAEVALAGDRSDEAVSLLRGARDEETRPFQDRALAWFLSGGVR